MAQERDSTLAYVPLTALVAGLLAMADFAAGGWAVTAASLAAAFGVGVGAGALLGAIWALLLELSRRMTRAPRVLLWVGAGALLASWLISQLGVLARLGGKDHLDAVFAAIASVGAGGLVLSLGLVAHPTRGAPAWLMRAPKRPIWSGTLLATLAALFVVVDRNVGLDAYRAAHEALRVVALVMLTILAVMLRGRWPERLRAPGRLRRSAQAAGVLALALPFALAIGWVGAQPEVLGGLLARPFSGMAVGALRELADVDRDGYAPILGGSDCAPFDPTIHPFAREIRGNGIDENCKLGDAPPFGRPPDPPIPEEPSPRSVVLVTIDCLRADFVSWGGDYDATPELARWSEGATRFTRAYASGAWTSLALSSLLRGVFPRRLEWSSFYESNRFRLYRSDQRDELRGGEELRLRFGLPRPDTHMPIQVLLQRRGMYTAAVVDDGPTGFLDVASGAYPGFDEYLEVSGRSNDAAVTNRAIDVLDTVEPDQEFFLWVHYFGPHAPHTWHRGTQRWGDDAAGRFAHEVAFTDAHLARLLARIDELGRERGSEVAVIITADHGERFSGSHRNHGINLTEDDLRIPLVVRGPGMPPGSSDALASAVDVVPTILAFTETPAPERLDGVALAALARGGGAGRILFAETWRYTANDRATHDMVAAFDGERKIVYDLLVQGIRGHRQPGDQSASIAGDGFAALQEALDLYLEQTGEPLFVD
ncbi:MAG: sulfatase-like hydrolase/transferase [Myxococcales bacterium]|nr:sulfatase-like hydrolase/transferase [Myxococcales bacterium]